MWAARPRARFTKSRADGNSSVFYDPKAKYIWALQFDAQGRLYVATGDKGEIFRVDASGKGEVFFDSKQTHIMCLRLDLERKSAGGQRAQRTDLSHLASGQGLCHLSGAAAGGS